MSGKFIIGPGDSEIRQAIQQSLQAEHTKIVLNLTHVTTADSSAIGEFIAAFTRLKGQGGNLHLCCLPPKVKDILTVTGLISTFKVFSSEEEAVASFT